MSSPKPAFLPWIRQVGHDRTRAATVNPTTGSVVIAEATFLQMLRLEQRRTERSGRHLMLVLIGSQHFGGKSGGVLVDRFVRVLSARIRETDVLGWYERDHTIGILMTEIGNADPIAVETIMRKISQALEKQVTTKEAPALLVSYQLFPQREETGSGKRAGNSTSPGISRRRAPNKGAEVVKRLMDVVGSLTALLLFLPVILLVALLVKLTSAGPVLFCQMRVGRHGQLFPFYKFRTMSVNNDSQVHREYVTRLITGGKDVQVTGGIYKMTNDPRITPLGHFLRKSSLDELPQFFNVLRNDMSLVGPRPPLPYEYECYQLWHRRRVLELKPGLTGIWQVEGRSRTTFDEMVRMDLRYAKTKSLWTDCTILLQTPRAILSGRGAC